jgi:hypothetical protein
VHVLTQHLELENLPDVINDLDVDFTENIAASNRYQHDIRNIRKVKEMTAKLSVNIITPLRPGKKLLVLDIDYSGLNMDIRLRSSLIVPPMNSHSGYQTSNFGKSASKRMRTAVPTRVLGGPLSFLR